MNHPDAPGQLREAEELVRWTCGERIRFLWYRLCLAGQEMAYASGRMIEFQMGLPSADPTMDQPRRNVRRTSL
jgi:hypothetical protein